MPGCADGPETSLERHWDRLPGWQGYRGRAMFTVIHGFPGTQSIPTAYRKPSVNAIAFENLLKNLSFLGMIDLQDWTCQTCGLQEIMYHLYLRIIGNWSLSILADCWILQHHKREVSVMLFKRKAYEKLLSWKSESEGRKALLVEGARRIGKSTIV